jgi:hypothetical protein
MCAIILPELTDLFPAYLDFILCHGSNLHSYFLAQMSNFLICTNGLVCVNHHQGFSFVALLIADYQRTTSTTPTISTTSTATSPTTANSSPLSTDYTNAPPTGSTPLSSTKAPYLDSTTTSLAITRPVSSDSSSSSSSSLPLIPIAIGIGCAFLLLVLIIVLLFRRNNRPAPEPTTRDRKNVSFQNPMYDNLKALAEETAEGKEPDYGHVKKVDGLYGEPAFMSKTNRDNPLFSSQDNLAAESDDFSTTIDALKSQPEPIQSPSVGLYDTPAAGFPMTHLEDEEVTGFSDEHEPNYLDINPENTQSEEIAPLNSVYAAPMLHSPVYETAFPGQGTGQPVYEAMIPRSEAVEVHYDTADK